MHNTMQQIYKPHTGSGWVGTHRRHGRGIKAWWGLVWVSFVAVLCAVGTCSKGERQAGCQAGARSGADICSRLAQNCCASVEPLRAVVEDRPPETVSEMASKYPVAASRWWRTPAGG